MTDPYSTLNLTREDPFDALQTAYFDLKNKYCEERFLDGEQGNQAAEKLDALEIAWKEIQIDQKSKKAHGGDFSELDALIKDGKLNEAQTILDTFSTHCGEWHYLQANVFFRREWHLESKRQLELALLQDEGNQKYLTAYERLSKQIGSMKTPPESLGPNPNQQGFGLLGGAEAQRCNPLCTCCALSLCLSACPVGNCGRPC